MNPQADYLAHGNALVVGLFSLVAHMNHDDCPNCKHPISRVMFDRQAYHCRWCGTLIHDDGRVTVPLVWDKLRESGGRCLRDDAAECVVWLVTRSSIGDTHDAANS